MKMNFKCVCGFNAVDISVGATQSQHYLVVMCFECHRLFSLLRRCDSSTIPICKTCGKPLIPITTPGAWGPPALQKKFPDTDPWLVDDESYCDDEAIEEEMDQFNEIRVMCPRCKNHSVEFEAIEYWD
jgi:ribosomal protein L37AE/L43A